MAANVTHTSTTWQITACRHAPGASGEASCAQFVQ